MNQLLKTTTNENNEILVYGRELHEGLGIKSLYSTWFSRMCEYGFKEGIDYITCFPKMESESHGGKNKKDHMVNLDMAKEICMLQRSEQGQKYRRYLLEIEKEWNSPEKVMARALLIAQKSLEIMKPKAEYYDLVLTGEGKYTATEIGAEFGITAKTLHEILHSLKIIKKVGGQWITTKKYSNMNLMQSETQSVNNINILTWKWTEEGRKFVVETLRKQGYTTIQESKQGNF